MYTKNKNRIVSKDRSNNQDKYKAKTFIEDKKSTKNKNVRHLQHRKYYLNKKNYSTKIKKKDKTRKFNKAEKPKQVKNKCRTKVEN
jgi:hypothetical protein